MIFVLIEVYVHKVIVLVFGQICVLKYEIVCKG